jgi:hypothetical protein
MKMKMKMKMGITLLSILTVVTGCSTTSNMTVSEKNDAYQEIVKTTPLESVNKIRSFKFNGWESLSNEFLIISTSPRKKYLVEINGFCPGLNFAQAIIVNQASSSTLSVRFDSISVHKSPQTKCFIKSIYPIDKTQEKALRDVGKPVESNEQSS